jgi:hypothetical protein
MIRLYSDDGEATKKVRLYDDAPAWDIKKIPNERKAPNVPVPSEVQNFPGSLETLSQLQQDPLSLKTNVRGIPSGVVSDLGGSSDAFWESAKKLKNSKSFSEGLGNALSTATRAGGVLFSPISAAFGAVNKLPLVGSISRLLSLPIQALGEGLPQVTNRAIDALPLSEQTKANIKPGVGEAAGFAAQIALGKAGEIIGKKGASYVRPEKIVDPATRQGVVNAFEGNTPKETPFYDPNKTAEYARRGQSQTPTAQLLAPEERPMLPGVNEQTLLPERTPQGSIQGEGFTAKDKATKQEVAKAKAAAEYRDALAKHTDKPTPTTLKRVLKAKEVWEQVNATAPTVEAPTQTTTKIRLYEDKPTPTKPQPQTPTPQVAQQAFAPQPEAPYVPRPSVKPSGVATDLASRAVERNMIETGTAELAGMDSVTVADQVRKAVDLVHNNTELARQVIRGEQPLPNGVRGEVVFRAAEDFAVRNNDVGLIRDLARSPFATKMSEAGLTMRLSQEMLPNSPLDAIREITKAREEKAVRANKDVQRVKVRVKNELKAEIAKQSPTKQTWSDFINTLSC